MAVCPEKVAVCGFSGGLYLNPDPEKDSKKVLKKGVKAKVGEESAKFEEFWQKRNTVVESENRPIEGPIILYHIDKLCTYFDSKPELHKYFRNYLLVDFPFKVRDVVPDKAKMPNPNNPISDSQSSSSSASNSSNSPSSIFQQNDSIATSNLATMQNLSVQNPAIGSVQVDAPQSEVSKGGTVGRKAQKVYTIL